MRTNHMEGSGFTLADGMYIPDVFVRTFVVIIIFYVFTSFLLTFIRMLLNHRLRSKMVSMEYTTKEIDKLLQYNNEHINYAVKWGMLMLGAAAGFLLMGQFRFGWHSLGVLAFCLALSYGGYYRYLKRSKLDS